MAESQVNTPFVVINADDFYGKEAYAAMEQFFRSCVSLKTISKNRYSMVGYRLSNTLSESGGVSRGVCSVNGQSILTGVVERHKIRAIPPDKIVFETSPDSPVEVAADTFVSMNFWGFTTDFFSHVRSAFHQFISQKGREPTSEFYIPAIVNQLIENHEATVHLLSADAQWFGITYQEDRPFVAQRILHLIHKGVYPNSFIINS